MATNGESSLRWSIVIRTAFINELTSLARRNERLFLVVGDLGFSVIESFAKEFPYRYLNAGVAEQNMTGVAAGLASEGYCVFTYSIANFPTIRCAEQIRNDVCYHNLPVTVVAVGGGMAYGSLGYSHHAVQDYAIMRSFPNMRVLAPGDPGEARESLQWLVKNPGPSYLRLGKAGEPDLHDVRGIDRGPLPVKEGTARLALVSTGGMLGVAVGVSDRLRSENIQVPVYSMPFLHPMSTEFLEPLSSYSHVMSLEEHGSVGGLGSILREYLPNSVEIISSCVTEAAAGRVGTQAYLRKTSGLDAESLSQKVKDVL